MVAVDALLSDAGFAHSLHDAVQTPAHMKFVNRKEEVISLAFKLITNSINAAMEIPDNQVYLLPFLPQMFGAGKTTIGKELLGRAQIYKNEISNALHAHIFTPPHKTKSELIQEQLDKFLGSTYIRVSLADLPSQQSNIVTFADALMSLVNSSLSRDNSNKQPSSLAHTLPDLVKSKARGPLVIHFDDIGAILSAEYNSFFMDSDHDPKWELHRLYSFWNKISGLYKMDGTYTFISGKKSALIFLGLKLTGSMESPTSATSVILRMFERKYIREIVDTANLWDNLGISDETLKDNLVSIMHLLTGGVPRLVSFVLRVLVRGGPRLGDFIKSVDRVALHQSLRELLYRVLTRDERSNVLASSEMLQNPTINEIYIRLLVISLRNKAIDKYTMIKFRDDNVGVPLSVLVSAVNCYVDKEVDSMWHLVFPELVLEWVANNTQHPRLSFFAAGLLSDPDVLNPGAVHEKIFRLTLETHLTQDPIQPASPPKPLGEVFKFLKDTSVATWRLRMKNNGFLPVPKIQQEPCIPLSEVQRQELKRIVGRPRENWLPSIELLMKHRRGEPGLTSKEVDKLRTFLMSTAHVDDSPFILKHLIEDGYLGCPTHSTSKWPDFVNVQHENGLGSAVAFALWWQIKLHGKETDFSWVDVAKEAKKVPVLGNAKQCLVIVSTHLNPEIVNEIGTNTHLVLPGESKRGKMTIPSYLDVVILGAKGLAEFYSEYDLNGLLRLASEQSFEAVSRRSIQPSISASNTVSFPPTPTPTGHAVKASFVKDGVEVDTRLVLFPFTIGVAQAKAICLDALRDKVLSNMHFLLKNNVKIHPLSVVQIVAPIFSV